MNLLVIRLVSVNNGDVNMLYEFYGKTLKTCARHSVSLSSPCHYMGCSGYILRQAHDYAGNFMKKFLLIVV